LPSPPSPASYQPAGIGDPFDQSQDGCCFGCEAIVTSSIQARVRKPGKVSTVCRRTADAGDRNRPPPLPIIAESSSLPADTKVRQHPVTPDGPSRNWTFRTRAPFVTSIPRRISTRHLISRECLLWRLHLCPSAYNLLSYPVITFTAVTGSISATSRSSVATKSSSPESISKSRQ